jgi:hypothetical protein
MRPVRLLRVGGIAIGIVSGSLLFAGGCGGGVPETGTQAKDMPSPVNIQDMYKGQPKAKALKSPPKYDMPGR